MNTEFPALLLAMASLPVSAIALLIDRVLGYPNGVQAWIGHPVQWMGWVISWLDRALNNGRSCRLAGVLALLILVAITLAVTGPLTLVLRGAENGWIGEALLASALLSQKSLEDHVRAVADGLAKSLGGGREAVRHIIGRDPEKLDKSGVTRGALESLAENMSDGVIAPLFWLLIAGLPGAALYKAINTADSMIGYKSEKYREFGWAAARVDDVVNLIPARLTGWLIALAAGLSSRLTGGGAVRAMARYAPKHLSPNAGWPEAAMAGALGVRLGGPRSYDGRKAELPWMGEGRMNLEADDIGSGLGLYNMVLNIVTALAVIGCVIAWSL